MEISEYEYDGSIPLEESNSVIVLETGEIFGIPDAYSNIQEYEVDTHNTISENQSSIFTDIGEESLFETICGHFSETKRLIKRITRQIRGKNITAIYKFDSQRSDKGRGWDNCLIEVESGFLISEKIMAPKGTGHAGIWIFSSKDDLVKKIGSGFRKVC